ncbi:hypothetical protein ACFGVR_20180 [Mucilaginibacter sp. AW1-3]
MKLYMHLDKYVFIFICLIVLYSCGKKNDGGQLSNASVITSNPVPPITGTIVNSNGILCNALRDSLMFTISASGTNPKIINVPNNLTSTDASWSPDGTKIVFCNNTGTGNKIFIINADGTDLKQITFDSGTQRFPTFSPDGKKLLFESSGGAFAIASTYQLHTINVDGTNEKQLTNFYTLNYNSDYTGQANWSPDGTQIIFVSNKDHLSNGVRILYIMNSDGSNLHKVFNDTRTMQCPFFSPDGKQILFEAATTSDIFYYYQIFKSNIDGSNEMQLTNFPHFSSGSSLFDAAWSPDGTKIVFVSNKDNSDVNATRTDIYIMNVDGSGIVRLTNDTRHKLNARWH